jgi:hypothetical protein|tara:strand:- start:990 stop:1817 length:828 start_codon:yes stop_codon:yes gene_type:complete
MFRLSDKTKTVATFSSRVLSIAMLATFITAAPARADSDRFSDNSMAAACGELRDHEIKQKIIEAALAYDIQPEVALSVAQAGSNFSYAAIGQSGERGIMQVRPFVAEEAFGIERDALWNADVNINVGVSHLSQLYALYGQRWDLALSHYRGRGRGNTSTASDNEPQAFIDDVFSIRDGYARNSVVQCYISYTRSSSVLAGAPSRLQADRTRTPPSRTARRADYTYEEMALPEAGTTFYPYGYDSRQLAVKERFANSLEDRRRWKDSLESGRDSWE